MWQASAFFITPWAGIEIIARERYGLLPMRQLDLENALAVVAEGHLGRHKIVAPHAAEAFIVKCAHLVDVRLEPGAPSVARESA